MDFVQDMHEWCVAEEGFFDRIKQFREKHAMWKDKSKDQIKYEKAEKKGPPYIAKDGTEFNDLDEMMQHNSFLILSKDQRKQLVRMIAQEEKKIFNAIDPKIRQGFKPIVTTGNGDFLNGFEDKYIWFIDWSAYDFAKAHDTYPREIWDHEELAGPLNAAMKFIGDEMDKFLKSKNIAFSECEYMGDWDDGSYGIALKLNL